MKLNILKQYVTLRAALEREHANLLAQLQAINAALGGEAAVPTLKQATISSPPTKRKRKMSAAGRAAIAAGARARWAKVKAAKGASTPKAVAKPKRRLSAAGKARIIAATKARWAKFYAAKAAR